MSRIFKQFASPAIIALLVGYLGSLSASAKQLPLTQDYFPDPVVRQWLEDKFPAAISGGMIETDKVTTISDLLKDYASSPYKDVEDLRCLRYFTKLSGTITIPNTTTFSKLKYIDVSGLNITAITNGIVYNATTTSTTKMNPPVEEIIADSCVKLTTFTFNNCATLARLSIKDCPSLTGFYCTHNNSKKYSNTLLRTIDLTGSPSLDQVWVSYNTNLCELRLAPSGRVLTTSSGGALVSTADINIQCGNCALEELDLRSVYTTANSNKKITVNLNTNNVRKILFNEDYRLFFKSFLIANNSLTALEIPYVDGGYTITTGSASSSSPAKMTCNVGPDDVIYLWDGAMKGTFSNAKNGTANKSQGTFTFSGDVVTTGSYTYKPYGNAGVCEKVQFTSTLNRKRQLQMWVCGTFNGWRVENGEWIKPDGWDEGGSSRWQFEYTGSNNYKLAYTGTIQGDFRILVNDPNYTGDDATYWLGASHADLVTPYTAIGGADYSGDSGEKGHKLFDITSEPVSTYDTFHYVAHVKNEGMPLCYVKDSPYPFSTHPCAEMAQTTAHRNPIFWVNLASGNKTSGQYSGGGDSSFDGGTVGVNGPEADFDLDAPEEWYNLHGVRVDSTNPGFGIYIVRKGTKATKILIP